MLVHSSSGTVAERERERERITSTMIGSRGEKEGRLEQQVNSLSMKGEGDRRRKETVKAMFSGCQSVHDSFNGFCIGSYLIIRAMGRRKVRIRTSTFNRRKISDRRA